MKTKKNGYILKLVLLIIVVYITRNLMLPQAIYVDGYMQFKGISYSGMETAWSAVKLNRLIGKMGEPKFNLLKVLFSDKIYSVKDDNDLVSLWYCPSFSEFGGYMYYSTDLVFPTLENIKPTRLIIGFYGALYKLNNTLYAYSEDEEIISEFLEIVQNGKQYDKDYTEHDKIMMQQAYKKVTYLSIFTEQVPGSALPLEIVYEDKKYYLIDRKDNKTKYDITYIWYRIVTEGELVK